MKEAFRQDYIVDFVKGRATDDIVSHHHEQLEEFGAGEDMPVKIWNPVIRQGMIAGYIHKDIESYGLLKMTAAGKRYVKNPTPFTYVEDTDFSETEEEASEAANVMELTITSSPSPKPAARAARCRAAVPLHTTTAYLACVNSHKCSSSSFTLGPQVM